MRKEVLFAIFFGAAFGLIVAFGVWRLNSSLSGKQEANQTEASPAPGVTNESFGLTIAKPNELSVHRESAIKITGATKPNSWVVASGEEEDYITKAGEDGGFEINSDLLGGLNRIIITSFDESGESTEKSLLLVHSSQFPSATIPQSESDGSADSVREKVAEKVNEVQNSPIAYIGTVTDIFESTIHVRNASEEITQVSTKSETAYANEITKKEVKFNDLAIGDFVIAMGFKNGNQVLNAERIVVSTQPKSIQREIHLGEVNAIKSKVMTLAKKEGTVDLTFPKTWKGPDADEIENKDKVIVITNSEGKDNVRTIQIIN